ncbi:MAG: AI-2E family transporter [Clostridia bacterium]|nr:AI-2E family transporter [Clostridia bacterium]
MTDPHVDSHNPTPESAPPTRRRPQKRWLFFGTLAVIFVVTYCIVNADSINVVVKRVGQVLSPVVIGCFIAYLCNPILKFYEYVLFRKLGKGNLRLFISLLCTFLTVVGVLAIILILVIPDLWDSINQLVTNYEDHLNGLLGFIQSLINKLPENVASRIDISDMEKLTAFIEDMFGDAESAMEKFLNKIEDYVFDSDLIGNVWEFVATLFSSFVDIILGIFIAFYILASKEKRVAQIRKFRAAYLNEKQESKLTEIATLVDQTFGGFFKGVVVDALLVGVMMYIALSIFRISEYNLLIATICALTNFIPVFGPFIGAIPSGVIILMTNPEKLLWFIIIVLVIQQLDGNILVPLIQGNHTGISSLAVLVSITIMGGFFKIPGMIFGVPVFAVIIELGKRAIEARLKARGRDTDTTQYYRAGAIGNAEEEVYYEHAHLKYKYDHSRIKVYVDKALTALSRNKKGKSDTVPPDDGAPDEGSNTDGTDDT